MLRDRSPAFDSRAIAMRFGVRQGSKIRVIDDCSLCKLNATVGLRERRSTSWLRLFPKLSRTALNVAFEGSVAEPSI